MKNVITKLAPMNWRLTTWRKFFAVSACWNFLVALPSFFVPVYHFWLFFGAEPDNFHTLYLHIAFFAVVFIFGIIYVMIAFDPPGNTRLIIVGIVGKIYAAVMLNYLFISQRATLLAAFGGCADFIFSLGFIYYLLRGPKDTGTKTEYIDSNYFQQ